MSFLCGIQLSSECEREGHAPLAPWVGLAFLFKHIYKKMLQPPILKPSHSSSSEAEIGRFRLRTDVCQTFIKQYNGGGGMTMLS